MYWEELHCINVQKRGGGILVFTKVPCEELLYIIVFNPGPLTGTSVYYILAYTQASCVVIKN